MQSDQGLGMEMGVGAGGECSSSAAAAEQQLLKAEMAVHPLWEQLLGAHVGCLRVATPIDHLPLIDAQLAQSHHLVRSYAAGRRPLLSPHEKQELDSFLVSRLATDFSSLPISRWITYTSLDRTGAVSYGIVLVQRAAPAARPCPRRGGRHSLQGDRAVFARSHRYYYYYYYDIYDSILLLEIKNGTQN